MMQCSGEITLTLTENSSAELFRVLKEQDEAFINAVFEGKCGFTLKATDGRSVEMIPADNRPEGEWAPFEYGDERWHKCTACGVADRYIEYVERPNGTTGKLVAIRNYCPHCGARMKGLEKDE